MRTQWSVTSNKFYIFCVNLGKLWLQQMFRKIEFEELFLGPNYVDLEGICNNMRELFFNRVKGFVEYDGFCPRSSTVHWLHPHDPYTLDCHIQNPRLLMWEMGP